MADDKIVIEIELDDGSVQKGFLKIEKGAKEAGDGIAKGLGKGIESAGLGKLATDAAKLFGLYKLLNGAVDLLGDAIRGAAAEADSINRLNTALQLTGKFSEQSAANLLEFSNELQASTKFANDAVLEVSALIQTLGNLDEQGLKQATKAALDLSTALGIDVNSAATLVGKAANGNVEAFKRYGVEIQKGATDAETFANALRTLEGRFGGASEAASQTFTGSLAKLENIFGDVLENIGFAITQSPALIALFTSISSVLVKVGTAISNSIGGKDILKPFLSEAINLTAFLVSALGPALELTLHVGEILVRSLVTGLRTLITAFLGVGSGIETILNKVFGTDSKAITEAFKTSLDGLSESAASTQAAFGEEFKTSMTENAINTLAEFKGAVDATDGSLKTLNTTMTTAVPVAVESLTPMQLAIQDLNANAGTLGQTFSLVGQGVVDSANKMALEGSAAFKKMGDTAIKGLGSAVGNAFSAFGAALVKGENALKAFTNAFLQSIGQSAVALGTELILRGTAYLFVPGLQGLGGPLIAAGASLAAFGGALSAVGGGGAPATSGGGAGQASGEFGTVGELPDTVNQVKPQNQIAVNIQGDVLDSSDTGLRIVDILRTFADKNGDVVTA